MTFRNPPEQTFDAHAIRQFTSCVRMLFMFAVCTLLCAGIIAAQKPPSLPKKLPSADKIIDNYLKAIGGKNKVAAIKDASYEWVIQL
ncbi:MAG TPA: hypothetical protein VIJ87_18885, partial [Pyrinomonadaceae bacterium]